MEKCEIALLLEAANRTSSQLACNEEKAEKNALLPSTPSPFAIPSLHSSVLPPSSSPYPRPWPRRPTFSGQSRAVRRRRPCWRKRWPAHGRWRARDACPTPAPTRGRRPTREFPLTEETRRREGVRKGRKRRKGNVRMQRQERRDEEEEKKREEILWPSIILSLFFLSLSPPRSCLLLPICNTSNVAVASCTCDLCRNERRASEGAEDDDVIIPPLSSASGAPCLACCVSHCRRLFYFIREKKNGEQEKK